MTQTKAFADPVDPLHVSLRVGLWLAEHAVPTSHGLLWPEEPHRFAGAMPRSYYEGSAGIGLFLIQLAHATRDERWLDQAIAAGEHLLGTYDPTAVPGANILFQHPPESSRWSFYTGVVGEANLFLELWRATGVEAWRDGVLRVAHDAIEAGTHADGVYWADQPGLMNDGGTALFLSRAGRLLGESGLTQTALRAGHRIAGRAEQTDAGWRWRSIDGSLLGAPAAYWPGLEFGVAGVAYAMATLFAESGDQAFRIAAERGADYLRSVAVTDPGSGSALVPYRLPDRARLFYLGTCNGAAGTTRTFYQLWRATGSADHLAWVTRLVGGIEDTGAPEYHSPGYWYSSSLCCGTAALLHLGSALWGLREGARYQNLAERAARKLVGDQWREGERSCWFDAFSRLDPGQVAARTSYSIGAAGIGSALLHLHHARRGEHPILRTIDDPFPTSEMTDPG